MSIQHMVFCNQMCNVHSKDDIFSSSHHLPRFPQYEKQRTKTYNKCPSHNILKFFMFPILLRSWIKYSIYQIIWRLIFSNIFHYTTPTKVVFTFFIYNNSIVCTTIICTCCIYFITYCPVP